MAHQVKDAVVRVRALDGTWETAGTDRSRGIAVENLEFEHDTYGPSSASFDLKRKTRIPWPDLSAFTDVEIEVGGVQVWKGRVKTTPANDSAQTISVQCEGLQFHLDDDVLIPAYVHTSMGDWKDQRSYNAANLTIMKSAPQVQAGEGSAQIIWPAGTAVAVGDAAGITLDLGPGSTAARIVVDWARVGPADSSWAIIARGTDTPDLATGANVSDAFNIPHASSGANNQAGSFAAGKRYLHVFVFRSASAGTTGQDVGVKISGIRAFRDAGLESGGASVLHAHDVIFDALSRGTVLLTDFSGVTATTFPIPDFFTTDQRSTRETIEAANAYHDYVTKVDERGSAVFKPKPAAPLIEVGEHTSLDFDDAAANSGEDIYNRVLVTGQTAASDLVVVQRSAGQQPGAALTAATSPAPTNPTFATNTTGWTATGSSTITRTTTAGEFDTSPAGGKWATVSQPDGLSTTFTGTFKAGITYLLQFSACQSGLVVVAASFGVSVNDRGTLVFLPKPAFSPVSIAWTPAATYTTGVTLTFGNSGLNTSNIFIDSLAIYTVGSTLVDRRSFRRTKVLEVASPLDTGGTIGAQLGDTYLANHKLAQFKGTATIIGPTAREILTGKSIPPEQLGMRTTELLRFNDRVDPDTGAMGRDGRMVNVKYTFKDDTAVVSLDNTSQNFEALLARLAVIQGAGQ